MSASISKQKQSISKQFFSKSASYLGSALGEYIKTVMPVSTDLITESKEAVNNIKEEVIPKTKDIFPLVRNLEKQTHFKKILNWYLDSSESYDSDSVDPGDSLSYDIPTDDSGKSEILEAQLTESEKSANKISKAVTEGLMKNAETQIVATANIQDSIVKLDGIVSAGFDRVNKNLETLIDVVTKNTSTLIEVGVTNALNDPESNDKRSNLLTKFDLNTYKDIVKGNINNTELGTLYGYFNMLQQMANSKLDAKSAVDLGFSFLMESKKGKNVEKALKGLDDAVNQAIIDSLIRLGENSNSNNNQLKNLFGKIFGINDSRKSVDTSRASVGLKAIPFDTVTKDYITDAIPGYLRKILIAVGGDDVVYDARSRSFRTKKAIRNDFNNVAAQNGNLFAASDSLRKSLGTGSLNSTAYDMLISDISNKLGSGRANNTLNALGSYSGAKNYLEKMFKDFEVSVQNIETMANNFANTFSNESNIREVKRQALTSSMNKFKQKSNFLKEAEKYNVDYSDIVDSIENELEATALYAGLKKKKVSSGSSIQNHQSSNINSGLDYTNRALWAVYKRLDAGINVFQTGSGNYRNAPYKKFGDRMLPRPNNVRTTVRDEYESIVASPLSATPGGSMSRMNSNSSGNRAKQIRDAVLSGDSESIRLAFNGGMSDLIGIGNAQAKKAMSSINQSFGNITGYFKHKLFGSEYSYKEQVGTDNDGKPIFKNTNISKNDKGGIFGFIKDQLSSTFSSGKEYTSKWMSEVKGYFDYGDKSKDPEERKLASKRKQIVASSIGAFAGAGIFGGPLGLLVGGIAGSALSTSSLGENLKEKLFGIDKKTGKSTGIFTKLGDKITRPIEYQFEKTTKYLGAHLKKGLLGPLSDIGFAIKNRVTASVDRKFQVFFDKVIDPLKNSAKKIGSNILHGAGWLGGKALEAVAGAKGTEIRAKIGAASTLGGGALGFVSNFIAGKGYHLDSEGNKVYDKDLLKQRRKERNDSLRAEIKGIKGESYSEFNQRKDAARKERLEEISAYMAEKTEANTSDIKESTEQAAQAVSHLDKLGSEAGSIFTHDKGIHERLDDIISLLSNKNRKSNSDSSNDDSFVDSALTAASSMIVSGDNIDTKEKSSFQTILDKSSKGNSNNSVSQALMDIVSANDDKKDDEQKTKESLMDKITGIVDKLPIIAAGLVALIALIKNPGGLSELLTRLSNGVGNLADDLGGDKKSGLEATTSAVNTVGSLIDTQAASALDLATPGASLYHNSKDGAGNYIKNYASTEAKDELLWKSQLRQQLFGVATPGNAFNNVLSNYHLNKADKLYSQSGALSNGGFFSRLAGRYKESRANGELDKAVTYDTKANSGTNTNAFSSIGRSAARIGVTSAAGGLAGWGAGKIAEGLGANEDTQAVVSNVASIGTAGALTINAVKSAAKGKASIVDNVIDALGKMFKIIAEKVAGSKLGKKIGASKISEGITKLGDKISTTLRTKIVDKIKDKIYTTIAKAAGEQAASVALAGLPIIAGGLSGLASGLCGTEYLFGVLPGEADAGMTAISSVLGTAFGALEMTPGVGTVVVVLDILDALLQAVPPTSLKIGDWEITFGGVGIKQMIARLIYKAFGGTENLEEKQQAFQNEKQYYEKTYGVSMNDSTFNDMVNNAGWGSRLWSGKAKVGEDGHLQYDDAGKLIKTGGISGLFSGRKTEYAKDENGQVVRDSKGNAVKSVDRFGNVIKSDAKFGDYVIAGSKMNWRRLFGGDIYETDENGRAIVDENGNYVVKSHSNGIVGSAWNTIKSTTKGLGKGILGAAGIKTEDTDDNIEMLSKGITSIAGQAISTVVNPFGAILKAINKKDNSDEVVKDKDGNIIYDENGKPLTKSTGNLAKYVKNSLKSITSLITDPINEMTKAAEEVDKDNNKELSKNGNNSWKDLFSKTFKGLSSVLLSPATSNLVAMGGPSESGSATSDQKSLAEGNPLSVPFKISSGFGEREAPRKGMHYGVDLVPANRENNVSVGTTQDAEVVSVKNNVPDSLSATYNASSGNYIFKGTTADETGNMVTLRTADGLYHKYMHLKAGSIPSSIRENQQIKAGTKIGIMGNTGFSTGDHLHYEIRNGRTNEAVDPTKYINGTTGSEFTATSASTQRTNSSAITGTTSTTTTDATVTQDKMSFGTFISRLMSHANKFLYKVTGGLIGSSDDNEDTTSSSVVGTTSSSSNGSYTEYATPDNIETTPNTSWVNIVKKVKKAVADIKPEYYSKENPAWINILSNGKNISTRPDCSGIIVTMLKIYGTYPENAQDSTHGMGPGNQYLSKDFTLLNWPGWDKLVEGDILCTPGDHVEVFARSNGSTHYVYNGGSTTALQSAGATVSGHSGYKYVWRCKNKSSQSVSNTNSDISGGYNPNSPDNTKEEVYNKLRQLGYTPEAASGIMGVWEAESSNKSKKLEGDYTSNFPGLSNVLKDNNSLNTYTKSLIDGYRNKGLSINEAGYKVGENYYPGIGIAQWTGPRAKSLFDYAKSKNQSWTDLDPQLNYFKQEMDTGVKKISQSELNSANSPSAAATLFANKFEGTSNTKEIDKRTKYAESIYQSMGLGMGGPSEGSSSSILSNPVLSGSVSRHIASVNRNTPNVTSSRSYISNIQTGPDLGDNYIGTGLSNDNLEAVTALLGSVLVELRSITGNTGTTNRYLNAMGENGFIDKGLRETLSSINQVKSKTKFSQTSSNSTNARAIAKIAKPL